MQLIFEGETPSMSITEEMSAIEQDTLKEKPLANGIIANTETASTETTENTLKNKEKVNNKENLIDDCKEVTNHKTDDHDTLSIKPINNTTMTENNKIENKPESEQLKSNEIVSDAPISNDNNVPENATTEQDLKSATESETDISKNLNGDHKDNTENGTDINSKEACSENIDNNSEANEEDIKLVYDKCENESVEEGSEENNDSNEENLKLTYEENESEPIDTNNEVSLDISKEEKPACEKNEIEPINDVKEAKKLDKVQLELKNNCRQENESKSTQEISLEKDDESKIVEINDSVAIESEVMKEGIDLVVKENEPMEQICESVGDMSKINKNDSKAIPEHSAQLAEENLKAIENKSDHNESVITNTLAEPMEVDDKCAKVQNLSSSSSIVNDLEKEVTASISAMVEGIVENFDNDDSSFEVDVELETDLMKSNSILSEETKDSSKNKMGDKTEIVDNTIACSPVPHKSGDISMDIDSVDTLDRKESHDSSSNSEDDIIKLSPTKVDKVDELVINTENVVCQDKTTTEITLDAKEVVSVLETETNENILKLESTNEREQQKTDENGSPKSENIQDLETESKSVEKNEDKNGKDKDASDVEEVAVSPVESEPKTDDRDEESKAEPIELEEVMKSEKMASTTKPETKITVPLIKLSNTMDILSDEEEEAPAKETPKENETAAKPIELDDDDDIMLIDDVVTKEDKNDETKVETHENDGKVPTASLIKAVEKETAPEEEDKDEKVQEEIKSDIDKPIDNSDTDSIKPEKPKQLLPDDFFKTYRKNLDDMSRDDLEEFCMTKIVESIIDRFNLNETKLKLKALTQTLEEFKTKAKMLTKQNRDLQVVLKSVQEEQKKQENHTITPLKITRSVGMQVLMTDKNRRRIPTGPTTPITPAAVPVTIPVINQTANVNTRPVRSTVQTRNSQMVQVADQKIPVPRLVPAVSNNANKTNTTQAQNRVQTGHIQPSAIRNVSPAQKSAAEKRPLTKISPATTPQSVTVDLTDDEPPSKIPAKNWPSPPVRLVNQQNLLAPKHQAQTINTSPRKVNGIPINMGTNQTRPGQTIILKAAGPNTLQGIRAATRTPVPNMIRAQMQVRRLQGARHPAPLPDAMKQYTPPNWKALPPAPDLKLSKVENGIVISWKIEGYQEDSYEEIASYQLYAYQETSAPPSTALWKKIGDVKALPLPMACTLTQFMAGYKYYFAVRSVDIRSRFGPFSLPGSILLLNKM